MEEYKTTLTAEPFLYNETKTIAQFILKGENSEELRKRNISENLIQYKQPKSISKVNRPIFRRIEALNQLQLNFFVNDEIQQSKYILVYAIMKTDKFVKDFIREVYYDKLLMNDIEIKQFEVDKWFENKCQIYDYLNNKSDSTKHKLKQVLMQIMSASGLVNKEKNSFKINRPLLSRELIELIEDAGDIEYSKTLGGIV